MVPCRCLELRGVNSPDCHVTFTPKSKHSSRAWFCPACQEIAYQTRKKKYPAKTQVKRKRINYPEESEQRTTTSKKHECICPRCGRTHTSNFYWSGKGTPRIYCQSCKSCDLNSPDVETYSFLEGVTRRGKW